MKSGIYSGQGQHCRLAEPKGIPGFYRCCLQQSHRVLKVLWWGVDHRNRDKRYQWTISSFAAIARPITLPVQEWLQVSITLKNGRMNAPLTLMPKYPWDSRIRTSKDAAGCATATILFILERRGSAFPTNLMP
jgi:hypothetical protein